MQEFVYQKGSERQGFRFSLAREAHLIFVQVEYETRSSHWHGCGLGIWDEREGRWKSYQVEVCPREVLAAAAHLSHGTDDKEKRATAGKESISEVVEHLQGDARP